MLELIEQMRIMLLSSNSCKFEEVKNMEDKNEKSLKRKVVEVAGWQIAKRAVRKFGKSVPVVGSLVAIGMVGYDIKKKGVVKGVINSGLDAIPLVGTGKNIIEFFTGDFLSDKPEKKDVYEREGFKELENKHKVKK